jgi:mRNA interferase MazF
LEVTRGDLVAVVLAGDYGRPRPALVVQADHYAALPSITVIPLTSEIHGEHLIRITVPPTQQTGLKIVSQVMLDKLSTVSRARAGVRIGQVDTATMHEVDAALAAFLGLA